MSNQKIIATLTELQELKRMREELDAEIGALEDDVKVHMAATGAEVLTAGPFRVTWKAVTSSRLDTAAIKKELPEIAERFTKRVTAMRFTVA